MPLIEEVGATKGTPRASSTSNNASGLPAEMAEAMAEMEAWKRSNPEAFELIMQTTLKSKENGDDEETTAQKVEAAMKLQQQIEMDGLMEAHHASQVASEGLELPGQKGKIGLDGQVKQTDVGIDITPTPAFVVKTTGVQQDGTQTKVFLNVCSHKNLSEPHMKKRLDENGEEVEGWNIPLAIGPPRQCIDKKGELSMVHDTVVNPEVIVGIAGDETGGEKDFLIQLALQYVEQKHKCELDRRYKLPKMTYKSSNPDDPKEVASQRIKDVSKQPSISEVSSSKKTSVKASSKKKKSVPLELKKLESRLWLIHADGGEVEDETRATTAKAGAPDPEKEPIVRLTDDSLESMPRTLCIKCGPLNRHAVDALNGTLDEECSVNVTCYDIRIKLPGHMELHVVFPYAVVPEEAESMLKPHDAMLEVRIAIDPTPYTVGADPGSRPWLLAQALEGGGDGRADTEYKQSKAAEAAEAKSAAAMNSAEEAENRFHLRAKRAGGFDPITGLVSREEEPVDEEEELPEDRFHKDDALSNHYISQREGDKEDKWKKHDREKAEREERKAKGISSAVDENVEYIDVEDFQPGGKYGPPAIDMAARLDEVTGVRYEANDDMIKASNVVAEAARQVDHEAAESVGLSPQRLTELKSTVWADLLD